ncbi:hypothetical protein J2Y58_003235 [Sphingomonas sp. BE138]|uniref:hypothetical protein n=1 Tax=Sphingomonas sp. BE138 TaxID=2817845 RepID=UPI0028646151|nr:hypothetical protein [Sphingomonas sp. BE138]MDR6789860.1 hypothetical protein [Sphingomonas sp. BE138]
MSIKGTLDPIHIGGGTRLLMRDSGRHVDKGWWGVDDNNTPHIGPYDSREACQAACDAINDGDAD